MQLLKKFFFVARYLRARLMHRGLKMTGFVFFEPDVSFKIECGGRVLLEEGVYIKKGAILECASTGTLIVKRDASIGCYAWIGCTNKVEIGVKTLVGQSATIFDVNHLTAADQYIADQGYTPGETIIGDDCCITAKATVGANVKIGRGAIVAAHAVVVKDVPEYSIVGGIPARLIKVRS